MNKMDQCLDICTYIGQYLSDNDKIHFSMCSTKLNKLRHIYHYVDSMNVKKILHLPYYDNFMNVYIDNTIYYDGSIIKFPQSVTHLKLGDYLTEKDIYIPPSVRHLTISNNFVRLIDDCIPSFITHLTFGDRFNSVMGYEPPSSVTHLTFGNQYDCGIPHMVPSTVTHLAFGRRFNRPILNRIPSSVTHLSLYSPFFVETEEDFTREEYVNNCIPSSVTHLTILETPSFPFKYVDSVPKTVINLLIVPIIIN